MQAEERHHAVARDTDDVPSSLQHGSRDGLHIAVDNEESVEGRLAGGERGRVAQIDRDGRDLHLAADAKILG